MSHPHPLSPRPLPPILTEGIIEAALAEDLGGGDPTSECTIRPGTAAKAHMLAKARLVVAGLPVARRVFQRLDRDVVIIESAQDGDLLQPGARLATIEGDARSMLAAERTALNFLQRLSGTATLTRQYVEAAAGRCRVVDTRKTTPGLRALQRYAVRCGGGHNHRDDLGGGVLIKENHIRAAGGIEAAVSSARAAAPHALRIECEVTSLDELGHALEAGADVVMLDNMDDAAVRQAVAEVDGRAIVEVSGNVTIERIGLLAELGVDVISVGALTHSAPAADISLLFETDTTAV